MNFKYDVIVIGGGHAGCEAAAAAANLGSKTLLITMDMNRLAQMSCNPAIGGIAKGQIVREIDALGGYMGIVADKTTIQFRMLNKSKGPAMWSPRSQNDRTKYSLEWRTILENMVNLNIWQDSVTSLLIDNNRVKGVKTLLGIEFYACSIIITAGTFLNGLMHVGKVKFKGGRISEPTSTGITEQLKELGIKSDRMKTGTPVRIDGRSVDFSLLTEQKGDFDTHRFSFLDSVPRQLNRLSCWTLYTNELCHKVLKENLDDSPLYNGQIQSIGPRYCPSIETKIVTFADKERHQLFLEPEGETTNEYYLNGFSSSLPFHIQLEALLQIPAFKNIHLFRPGYAIEYDFFDPTQLNATLESKIINNLFFAGQINGTTGYEEAAAQGLIAGINAHLKTCTTNESFTLKRNEAYIGVLIDDLINKGVDEPYRMFTSRAEYRILLRQDNADIRLTPKAISLNLADDYRKELFIKKKAIIDELITFISNTSISTDLINPILEKFNSTPIPHSVKLKELIKRPTISLESVISLFPSLVEVNSCNSEIYDEILEETEILIKYEGYILRETKIADKLQRLENIRIRDKFNYSEIQSLSTEARQKLSRINPETIAQASRIPGVSPSDINVLLVLSGR
jgi:tRNA uridine 5-carboxymethylaminomethyl modification enzyme